MKEKFSATIDNKGRILVPAYFRDRLGLQAGDRVNVELETAEEGGTL